MFAIVSFGAIVLTVNVVLLGGNIGFFQVHFFLMSGDCAGYRARSMTLRM